jgi:hypothetical protein
MKRARARATAWIALVAAPAGAAIVALAAACGATDSDSAPYDPDAAVDRVATSVHAASACGQCVAEQCKGERRGCAAEPACAAYLTCADACPSAASGDIDPACEAACSRPSEPAGAAAFDAFTLCRTRGAGASCRACGPRSSRYRDPILQQVCTSPAPPLTAPITFCGTLTEAVALDCRRCQYERCCETRGACDDSPKCVELRACVTDCSSINRECFAKYDDAVVGLLGAHRVCTRVWCSARCITKPLDACHECIHEQCGDETVALYGSGQGVLLDDCEFDCKGDAGCSARCLSDHPSLTSARASYDLCIVKRCLESCGRP